MAERNPRFPHTLTVYRAKRDSSGNIILDVNGDPTYEILPLDKVALSDGYMMRTSAGAPIIEGQVTSIACGYRTNTRNTSEYGDVVVYNVTLHTPPFTTPLLFDDILEITDYERTYRAKVVKKMTFNWGTDIWFDEVKN